MVSLRIKKKKLFFGAASIFWCLLLCVLALQPRVIVSSFLRESYLSSVAHVAGHFILALGVSFALHLSSKKGFRLALNFLLVVGVCIFSGILTEALQIFASEREPSWSDFRADMKGGFMGILTYFLVSGLKRTAFVLSREGLPQAWIIFQIVFFPRRPAQLALILSSSVLFLGLDSIQFLTVYCLASCF